MSDAPQDGGWWRATDGKWYPPHLHPNVQSAQSTAPPEGVTPPPYPSSGDEPWVDPSKQARTVRLWVAVTGAVVALLLGMGCGAVSSAGSLDQEKARAEKAEAQVKQLQSRVDDRQSQAEADQAAAKRAEAERLAEEQKQAQKAEDDRRKAEEAAAKAAEEDWKRADAAATEQRKQQEAAAAEQRKQQEAAAAEQAAAAARRRTIPEGGGIFAIGPDVDPGQWRTSGPNGSNLAGCYYAVLNQPNGGIGNIVDNNIVEGPALANLPNGKYFETQGCAEWTLG